MLKTLILATFVACSAAFVVPKTLPFVDSSLPITFKGVIAEPAPKVISNSATYGFAIDFSVPATLQQLQAVRQAGYNVVFIRGYTPAGQGTFDTNSVTSLRNAYSAGLGIEVYMTPQPASSKQGYQQLDEVYNGMTTNGITIRAIWIQVTSPANWPGTVQQHINFINSIVARARQYGLAVGIYTNNYDWSQITGGWNSVGNDVLLWYWNVLGGGTSGETPADFSDFRSFGNWIAPSVKQFAQVEVVAGITVNRNVYTNAGAELTSVSDKQEDKIVAGNLALRIH
ncbi:unnamed protein product [Caenorhabditis bovis]|uniref:Uncharacterized protein n=1 Tax=Caenorhabditis bovis TaxID=2654633 RepID=A0A8S1F282_9PELO|nr:unnamed protein product [Caenorhabditis bovis]